MSYDVDDPIPYDEGSQEFFREIDRRIFHPRYMRLTADASGKPFSLFVDFDSLRGKDVLDVGIGSGIATQMLAEAGANVTGVDLTDWAVETTRRRLAAFGLEADVRQADAEQLPFDGRELRPRVLVGRDPPLERHGPRARRARARDAARAAQIVLMVYHRRSLFFLVYRGFQRFLPLARRLGLHFEGARAGETRRADRAPLHGRRAAPEARRRRPDATCGSSRTGRTPSCCRCRGGSGCRSRSASRAR